MREYLQTGMGEDVFSCNERTGRRPAQFGSHVNDVLLQIQNCWKAECASIAVTWLLLDWSLVSSEQWTDKCGFVCSWLSKYNLRPGFTLLILNTDLRRQKLCFGF